MRNTIGKVVLNASIYAGLKIKMTEKVKSSDLTLTLFQEGQATPCLLRCRKEFGTALSTAIEQGASS